MLLDEDEIKQGIAEEYDRQAEREAFSKMKDLNRRGINVLSP